MAGKAVAEQLKSLGDCSGLCTKEQQPTAVTGTLCYCVEDGGDSAVCFSGPREA